MALDVATASLHHPQDLSCKWRLRPLVGPRPRPEAPSLQAASALCGPWPDDGSPRAHDAASRLPAFRPPVFRRPPAASARRDRPGHPLPIASLLNPHTGLKRRRHALDVDGPGTAALSSKKRRLRLHLVTSPLSRPYSHPPSHIHLRADAKAETSVAAQPRLPHLPATSFLRLSVANRLRERMHLRAPASDVCPDPLLDAAPGPSWLRPMPSGPGPCSPGPVRRSVAKRPDGLGATATARDGTLPRLQSQPAAPPPGLKLAAIDTITSLLSDAPPLPSEDRLFTSVVDEPGRGTSALSEDGGEGVDGDSCPGQHAYCDFGMLLEKSRSCSPDGQGLGGGDKSKGSTRCPRRDHHGCSGPRRLEVDEALAGAIHQLVLANRGLKKTADPARHATRPSATWACGATAGGCIHSTLSR